MTQVENVAITDLFMNSPDINLLVVSTTTQYKWIDEKTVFNRREILSLSLVCRGMLILNFFYLLFFYAQMCLVVEEFFF